MQKKLKFLRISSIVLKIIAWIFLFMGIIGGITALSGYIPDYPRWIGLIVILFYIFSFMFLYMVAIMADILIEIKKED